MIDVLTLNYNDYETTVSFVEQILKYKCVNKLLIVDNCSTDDSYEKLLLLKSDRIEVVKTNYNGGYGYGNNFGIKILSEISEINCVLLANPDTFVSENVLEEMENFLEDNLDCAVVAPFMMNQKKEKQSNTAFKIPSKNMYIFSLDKVFSKFTDTFYYKDIKTCQEDVYQVGSVSGSLFMFNRDLMLKHGMFDENIFLYCEEVVLGIKMQNSDKKIFLLPNLSFIHAHSVSINKSFASIVERQKMLNKSKLYVIKNYYKIGKVKYLIAKILARLNILETKIISFCKRGKHE